MYLSVSVFIVISFIYCYITSNATALIITHETVRKQITHTIVVTIQRHLFGSTNDDNDVAVLVAVVVVVYCFYCDIPLSLSIVGNSDHQSYFLEH